MYASSINRVPKKVPDHHNLDYNKIDLWQLDRVFLVTECGMALIVPYLGLQL